MSRITRFLTGAILCALIFTATPVSAQCSGTSISQSCTWTATVTVMASLTCSVTQNFSFGSFPSSIGSVTGNELNTGRILCSTDPGNLINVSFVLPSVLTRVGGAQTVPITFGTGSARLYNAAGSAGPVTSFDPALGFTGFSVGSGNATLTLGENGPNEPSAEVSVLLTGASAGTYTGVITATVVLQ